jgi:hypothetical protein
MLYGRWSQAASLALDTKDVSMIDQERADLRELLAENPTIADELATEGTQFQMGARSVVIDCLGVFHEDPDRVIARLIAWDLASRG